MKNTKTVKNDPSEHVGVVLLCIACAALFAALLVLGGVWSVPWSETDPVEDRQSEGRSR